jgi:hypothetical protein
MDYDVHYLRTSIWSNDPPKKIRPPSDPAIPTALIKSALQTILRRSRTYWSQRKISEE